MVSPKGARVTDGSKFVLICSICISACCRPTLLKIPHSLSSCHLFLCCVPFPESCLGAKQQLFSQLVANWICLLFWAEPAAHNGLLELLTATCFSWGGHPQEWWAKKTVKTRTIKWKQKGAKTLEDKEREENFLSLCYHEVRLLRKSHHLIHCWCGTIDGNSCRWGINTQPDIHNLFSAGSCRINGE